MMIDLFPLFKVSLSLIFFFVL